MTALLPDPVKEVFERFVTTEYTTVDGRGQPITWPVTPYYEAGGPCIDITTGVGYPKKANDARANPKVALLFSDPTGSGTESAPQVLVQGIATIDDADLDANADRYDRESKAKLPAVKDLMPPKFLNPLLGWYRRRIYVKVRPERIYVWPEGDPTKEPELLDSHLEEVRSGHDEEPDAPLAEADRTPPKWDERIDELGRDYPTAVLTLVAPDGFPFSLRVPITVDAAAKRVRIGGDALGIPVHAGLACITAHSHAPDFSWQRNFQVRGDLVEEDEGWAIVPHKLVGGFELPPNKLEALRINARKSVRFAKTARREQAEIAARRRR